MRIPRIRNRPTENRYPNEAEIIAAVEAEFHRGGRPIAKYGELHAVRNVSPLKGSALTTRMLLNLEDRLVAIEDERATTNPAAPPLDPSNHA
jgi:hypothetical protein